MAVLRAIRGDTFEATVYWEDSAGAAINLAGYTVTFTVIAAGESSVVPSTSAPYAVMSYNPGPADDIL